MDYLEVTMTKDCVKIFSFLYKIPHKSIPKGRVFQITVYASLGQLFNKFLPIGHPSESYRQTCFSRVETC